MEKDDIGSQINDVKKLKISLEKKIKHRNALK
jgi:hypothetical protein